MIAQIKRELDYFVVYFNDTQIAEYSCVEYSEDIAHCLAKAYANGWDDACELNKYKPELFRNF